MAKLYWGFPFMWLGSLAATWYLGSRIPLEIAVLPGLGMTFGIGLFMLYKVARRK